MLPREKSGRILANLSVMLGDFDLAQELLLEAGNGAFDDLPPLIAPHRPAVLRRWLAPAYRVRGDLLDAAPGQLLAQSVAVVAFVGNHSFGLLPQMA